VREPPPGVAADAVARAVGAAWALGPVRAVHLPVGFGAHHWRVVVVAGDGPALFATLDRVDARRDGLRLGAAYAAARDLAAQGLDFVVAPLPALGGRLTVGFADGRLSCTPWIDAPAVGHGPLASDDEAATTAGLLDRLHRTPPPAALPRWRTTVPRSLVDDLVRLADRPWGPGPYADRARDALAERLDAVAGWCAEHRRLLTVAERRPWVTTHGEPHTANQLRTPGGPVLVDWESAALAPRERDLGGLVAYGWPGLAADPAMLALFDLEWRLDEVGQYAAWFAAPHAGTADDAIAFEGFLEELSREERFR
jgi:spectinomycin phosphotransferase